MIIHKTDPIELPHSGDYRNLYVLGDFHFGGQCFDINSFRRVRNYIKKDKKALILFLGDFTELHSTTIRKGWDNITQGREDNRKEMGNILDAYARKEVFPQLDWITKDNCIGMFEGNHYISYPNGTTDLMNFCELKKIKYLGAGEANIYLRFYSGQTRFSYPIKAYHSHQAGESETYDITRLIKRAKGLDGFKLVCKAHTHRPLVFPIPKEFTTDHASQVKEDVTWLVNAGSLYKYRLIQQTPTYPEMRNYNPTAKLLPCITLRLVKSNGESRIESDGHYRYVYA